MSKMSETFLIRHRSGGKFFHPYGGQSNPQNDTDVVVHGGKHDRMHWKFEQIDDHWGYITHAESEKIIHPHGGSSTPGNVTRLVLHDQHHFGALFAMDAVNDHIIHKGGKYAHPRGGSNSPSDNTNVVLHEETHDGMRFHFVSPNDVTKDVLVYGYPTLGGTWKIINMVKNPIAEHTSQLEIKIGKSTTESSSSSFQYGWEVSVGVMGEIFSATASQSLQYMYEKSSSETWTEEITKTTTINVKPGKTVVTWQYMFDVKQNATKNIYQSNLLADTESETQIPDDLHMYSLE